MSSSDHKFHSTVRLYANAGFQLGIEWEVTRGGGGKWRAEEQLHQRAGEGSGIYVKDRAI